MPELTLELLHQQITSLTARVQELEDKQPVKKLVKPTLTELESYMKERGLVGTPNFITSEANKYLNHYNSNGWKVGKNSMKDWKAAARNWVTNIQEGTYNGKNITGNSNRQRPDGNGGTGFGRI